MLGLYVLLVEEDEAVRDSLRVILEAEGYEVASASNFDQALAMLTNRHFDVTIIAPPSGKRRPTSASAFAGNFSRSCRCGVCEHLEICDLLQRLQEISPETVRILIMGHSCMVTTFQALHFGVQAYLIKPVDPQELLDTIRSKLDACLKPQEINDEKMANLLNMPGRIWDLRDFREYLQDMAKELTAFGLTENQAKVYVALNAFRRASASEIAAQSGVRREEVYRIIPELEKIGIVTEKIDSPRRFLAVPPENAIQVLINSKFVKATEELNAVESKRSAMIDGLGRAELRQNEPVAFINSISTSKILLATLLNLLVKAKCNIDAIMSQECLRYVHSNFVSASQENRSEGIKINIIMVKGDLNDQSGWLSRMIGNNTSGMGKGKYELTLRFMEKLPFSLLIVDDAEAIWGHFELKGNSKNNLWTNDKVQIEILKMTFDNLWKNAVPPMCLIEREHHNHT